MWSNRWKKGVDYPEWADAEVYKKTITGGYLYNGETPKEAYECFMGTELDYLVIGNCILDKNKQNSNLKKDYIEKFELD